LKLENGSRLHLNNILYVPSLKKDFISISCLEDKGERVAFVDGKVWFGKNTLALIKLGLLEFVKEAFIELLHHLLKIWFIWKSISLSYDIGGMVIYIIGSSLLLVNWFMESSI